MLQPINSVPLFCFILCESMSFANRPNKPSWFSLPNIPTMTFNLLTDCWTPDSLQIDGR